MADWWDGDPDERYWCEITDREDVGADLHCPQLDEGGRKYWSYSLIGDVRPGDVVFHYSTRSKAFVGASVAGAPLQSREIVWVPHGTVGQSKPGARTPRPGWWLPLYSYTDAESPLTLEAVRTLTEEEWIRDWIAAKDETTRRVAAPFQRYGSGLRGAQGYLTKMPKEFVRRWSGLSRVADSVGAASDELAALSTPPTSPLVPADAAAVGKFLPKSDTPYNATIGASTQRRTRNHETLVRRAGRWLQERGAAVSTPHPIDLLIEAPLHVIVEAKVVGSRSALFAIRDASSQLREYHYFLGPEDALLAILLDRQPEDGLGAFVEDYLGMLLMWWTENGLAGPRETASHLESVELALTDSGMA